MGIRPWNENAHARGKSERCRRRERESLDARTGEMSISWSRCRRQRGFRLIFLILPIFDRSKFVYEIQVKTYWDCCYAAVRNKMLSEHWRKMLQQTFFLNCCYLRAITALVIDHRQGKTVFNINFIQIKSSLRDIYTTTIFISVSMEVCVWITFVFLMKQQNK